MKEMDDVTNVTHPGLPPSHISENTPATTPSTWAADDELCPRYSRWMDLKGRLFIVVSRRFTTEPGGCRAIQLLDVAREQLASWKDHAGAEVQELDFQVFKDYVRTNLLKRKK